MPRERVLAAGLFLFVFLVYILSPNATPFDSRWTVHTALSLLHQGNTDLDEYLPLLEKDRFYGIECVFPDGRRIYPVFRLVSAMEWGLKIMQPVLAPLALRMHGFSMLLLPVGCQSGCFSRG